MKIVFPKGFQGRETNNIWYPPGKVVEFDGEIAEDLLAHGFAVSAESVIDRPIVDPVDLAIREVEEAAKPKDKPKGKRRGGK
jgi:hypothetical protein